MCRYLFQCSKMKKCSKTLIFSDVKLNKKRKLEKRNRQPATDKEMDRTVSLPACSKVHMKSMMSKEFGKHKLNQLDVDNTEFEFQDRYISKKKHKVADISYRRDFKTNNKQKQMSYKLCSNLGNNCVADLKNFGIDTRNMLLQKSAKMSSHAVQSPSKKYPNGNRICVRSETKHFNFSHLRSALKKFGSIPNDIEHIVASETEIASNNSNCESLNERMHQRLHEARFRFLNEQLYTCTGIEALELFMKDRDAFAVYHNGFQSQVAKWPINPVEKMIEYIQKRYEDIYFHQDSIL